MKDKMTNVEVKDFLVDFKNNSETFVLEEGSKEKIELEKIAEARGYSIKNSRDLGLFKTVYAFTDRPNTNGAILPTKDLLKILPQIVGKPISVNHNRGHVIGHYIDYKYIAKENKIIAYGAFYKSNFDKLWQKAQNLFKSKKLTTSFEIWTDKKARKYITPKTYEMVHMEIAGGALLFEGNPSFEGADVLALGRKKEDSNMELVYASKHNQDELITSEEIKVEDKVDAPVEEVHSPEPVNFSAKVTCANCKEIFDKPLMGDIKCPKCLSILDGVGTVIYPPQIRDYSIDCPSCKNSDWLILLNEEKTAKIRCKMCSKVYKLEFSQPISNEFIENMSFVNTGRVNCHQCNTPVYYSGMSGYGDKTVTCPKCKLEFSFDLSLTKKRIIKKIDEVKIKKLEKSSEERGHENNMEIPKEVVEKVLANEQAKKEVVEVEKEKTEHTDEAKKEETVVEEKKSDEIVEASQTEEVIETKEPKVETPIVEEKPEVLSSETIAVAKVDKYAKSKSLRKAVKKMKVMKEKSDEQAKKLVAGIKKTVATLISSMENVEKVKEESTLQIAFYKEHAKVIHERRTELENTTLTDEEILNDDKFELAKAQKETILLKASRISEEKEDVGEKKKVADWYSNKRKKVDEVAFGNNK